MAADLVFAERKFVTCSILSLHEVTPDFTKAAVMAFWPDFFAEEREVNCESLLF